MSELIHYQEMDQVVLEQRPLLMVDWLEIDVAGKCACGLKLVSVNEEYFQGPGYGCDRIYRQAM